VFDLAEINLEAKIDTKQLDQAIEKAKELKELTKGMTWQNRLKSKVLWGALASALLLLGGEWGLYEIIGIKQEALQHTIDFILLCLTGFGIINSPDNKDTL
jgi:uncharacterized membrane protein